MAKPVKLPRKLRAKLAEIAAKREARDAEAETEKNGIDFATTFYSAFFATGSAHMMHMVIDHVQQRMVSHVYMNAPYRPKRVLVPPPWEGTARDAAE